MRGDDACDADGLDALSDDALIARHLAGDRAAWPALVRRHAVAIQRVAWFLLRDRSEAEDIAQETFLRLLRKAPSWRPGRAQLRTWLHRVAVNLAIDRRRRRRFLADSPPPEAVAGEDAPRPDRALDVARAVGRALDLLPERQRTAIVLVHYQGFSNLEAARTLAVSVEALESLLARGRRAMRKTLAADAADLLED